VPDPSPAGPPPGPSPRPAQPDAGAPFAAALGALILALGLTWPAALHLRTRLIGHPGNDGWNHAWGYDWVYDEVAAGRFPATTDLLSYPRGGSLYFIDTVQALLSLPAQHLLGPAAAYNLVMIAGFTLAGLGAWLLARRLTGDPAAAAAALVLYEANPHLLGQAYNGISETVCAGWLPLTLWALVRLLDRPTAGRAAALGLLGALTMLSSWYYGLFAALAGLGLVTWQAARQPWTIDWRRTALGLGGAAAVALAGVAPLLLQFRGSLEAADALVTRDPEFVRNSLMQHNITDALSLLLPGKTPSPDLFALYGEQLVIVIYLGWTGLLLAGAALLLTRRGRELGPWVALGSVFLLFGLGPYLYAGGAYVQLGGRPIPLPFLLLFDALPLFDRISHPFRFVLGVSLVVALLAAHGLRHLLRRQAPALRLGAALLVGALALVEVQLGSPATLPVPTSDARVPAAYAAMLQDPVPGAVLDLPMTVPNLERAVYTWYQAVHGRPVPWGLNEPMPRGLLRNRLTATLIRLEATRARSLPPRLPELDLVLGARALELGGYRYVVLHEDLIPAFKRAQIEAVLRGVFGEPARHDEDRLLVWTLEPPAAQGEPGAPG
jgi:hypothetical protein